MMNFFLHHRTPKRVVKWCSLNDRFNPSRCGFQPKNHHLPRQPKKKQRRNYENFPSPTGHVALSCIFLFQVGWFRLSKRRKRKPSLLLTFADVYKKYPCTNTIFNHILLSNRHSYDFCYCSAF